jgi:hypothetical protein
MLGIDRGVAILGGAVTFDNTTPAGNSVTAGKAGAGYGHDGTSSDPDVYTPSPKPPWDPDGDEP